ncbi:ABC transporter [Kitasatospora phosalacinea]|uniref:ABC transporter n=1 Tax=Kitasatospora phosalacinea TaxID=2065 RepID=A0A9W6V6N6_9ACTN|nr:ATP-binding cassette domain-containing protein [Kitasatospora phosalacinea]GLW74432.1 ABC transporter [Kitasatospora phosalacinea]
MIQVRGLTKTFSSKKGNVTAVAGVDFEVGAGEIVGFLGPNGAGKTTTMRMLTTLLKPSGGSAVIAGHDLLRASGEVRRTIGYVSQTGGAKPAAIIRNDIVLQGRLHGMSKSEAHARADAVLAEFEIEDLAERTAATLSGGQRRRVDMALGLVHRPPVLFLDEPTANLDPQSRALVWSHIRRLREEHGTTVFISTHYLDEADNLCDRVLIIDRGRVVAEDTPEQLKAAIAHDTVQIDVADAVDRAVETLARVDGVHSVSADGNSLSLACDQADQNLSVLLRQLDLAEVRVESVRVVKPSLDDVFMAITHRGRTEATEHAHA